MTINYRASHGLEIHKAWTEWKKTVPQHDRSVFPFVAGYNAAKDKYDKENLCETLDKPQV